MTNATLFYSSVLFSIIQSIVVLNNPNVNTFYKYVLFNCCLSSLMNHATTYKILKYYDRATMAISFWIDLYFIFQTGTLNPASFYLLLAIWLYIASGIVIHLHEVDPFTNILHVCSHILITITHILIIVEF